MICELVRHKSYVSFPALHLTFSSTALYLFSPKHSKRFITKHHSLLCYLLLRPWLTGLCAPSIPLNLHLPWSMMTRRFSSHLFYHSLGFLSPITSWHSGSLRILSSDVLSFYKQSLDGHIHPTVSTVILDSANSAESTVWSFKVHTSLPALSSLSRHKSTSPQNGTTLLPVCLSLLFTTKNIHFFLLTIFWSCITLFSCPRLLLDLFPLDYPNNGLGTELPLETSLYPLLLYPPQHCFSVGSHALSPTPNILVPFRMSQLHLPLLPPTQEAVPQTWCA